MQNLQTTQLRDSPPEWLRDVLDAVVVAVALLALSLAALL
jgi:hypothetical protein